MTHRRHIPLVSALLLVALVAGAILARTPAILHLNRSVAEALRPVALRYGWLNVIWVLGGLPVTLLMLVIGLLALPRLRRRAGAVVLAAICGSAIELVLKHLIALPVPPEVPAPALWNHLSASLNFGPSNLTPILHRLFPHAHNASGPGLFPGSYPSGHVFRTTFVTGVWLSGKVRWVAVFVAAAAAFMTVATGGHWLWDTLGGTLLAGSMVMLAGV